MTHPTRERTGRGMVQALSVDEDEDEVVVDGAVEDVGEVGDAAKRREHRAGGGPDALRCCGSRDGVYST
jgi:hypothetical protein